MAYSVVVVAFVVQRSAVVGEKEAVNSTHASEPGVVHGLLVTRIEKRVEQTEKILAIHPVIRVANPPPPRLSYSPSTEIYSFLLHPTIPTTTTTITKSFSLLPVDIMQ